MKDLCGHVVSKKFSSQEEMVAASVLLQHEEYQLNKGSFKGFASGVHTSHIQLSNTFRSRGIFYKGKGPANAYVFSSIASKGKLTHNGLRLDTDELIVLNDEDRVDLTASEASDILGIVIDKDFFEAEFEKHFNQAFEYDKIHKRLLIKINAGSHLRKTCKEVLTGLLIQGDRLKSDPLFHDKTEQDILQILFQSIDFSRVREKELQSEIDANKVREYIEHHYKEHIELKDLLATEKFFERTIRSGFNTLFGFPPKQYLKCYRLGKVQHVLLQNDPSTELTVENIAYDHGFSHMGRFSCQYKQMFGKTPSTSLKELSPYPDYPKAVNK